MASKELQNGPERLAAFSDGVIAIIITVMVLDLKPPHGLGLRALWPLWPILMSYALSFLFASIAWVNHHQLLRLAEIVDPCLIWSNMAFLFTLSLIPFGTAYMAEQRMAPFTVALYAFTFLLTTVAFIPFEAAIARQNRHHQERAAGDRAALLRNLLALALYGGAIPAAYLSRWLAFALVLGSCLLYFAPEKLRSRR